jgi:PAS domain-containing protein
MLPFHLQSGGDGLGNIDGERGLLFSIGGRTTFPGGKRGEFAEERDVERYVAAVPGVSGGREAEDAMRRQALLLELTPVLMRDPEDRIIYWNRAAEILYGFTGEQALGG